MVGRTAGQHITAPTKNWRLSAPHQDLWLTKALFSASTFVLKIPPNANLQNVITNAKRQTSGTK